MIVEPNEFEAQEQESLQGYIKKVIQDKVDELKSNLGILTEQANEAELAIEVLDEPIRELTPSDDLEGVKMILNQVVRELNKLLS